MNKKKKEIRQIWAQKKADEIVKEKKEKFWISTITFFISVVFYILIIIFSEDHESYYRLHNNSFLYFTVIVICSVIIKMDAVFFSFYKNISSGLMSLGLTEKTNMFLFANFIIALIGLLIVDVSFIQVEVRIPTVVVITLIKIVSLLVQRNK